MTTSPTPRRAGRPPRTSRAQIVAAARKIIDTEGWEKLTLRRLAAQLGIGTTTLYHHVRDREDLLILLINDVVEQHPLSDVPTEPRDRIVAAATTMRDALAAAPWAAEVLATDGFLARVGPGAITLVETIVAAATEYGCTHEQAVRVFRSLWYFTVGEIVVRTRTARRPKDFRFAALGDLDPATHPQLVAIGDELWQRVSAGDHYEESLRAFVDGLLAQAIG
ncbi:TetR/AcrR family transcriptional regulator [Thermocrispum municipale]|uniref:TetR/AcrR family transcriptional regulator n=1 Tax=Thermocrispum municipale TaxID=37926 RepID=UPI00048B13EC|nr:TetR/AcrR family transcriptional regulator [Thermocrispum municipale]